MPTPPETVSPSPPPRRSLRVILVGIVAALLLPIVSCVAWSRIEASRLDAALEALEARGEPLDIADFYQRPTTSAGRQASHLYAETLRLAGTYTRRDHSEAIRAIQQLCSPQTPPANRAEQIAILQTAEEEHKAILASLDRAAAVAPEGWEDTDRPLRGSMDELRPVSVANANAIRIARLACTGHGDEAATALLASLRLSRLLPSFYSRPLIATAQSLEVVLTFGVPGAPQLQALQTEYEKQDDVGAVERRLRFLRANWLQFSLPGVVSDPPEGLTRQRINPLEAILTRLTRPVRDHAIVAQLREFDDALAVANAPWPAKLDAGIATTQAYRRQMPMGRRSSVQRLLEPFGRNMAAVDLESAVTTAAEALARTRASVAALAVARFQRTHDGNLPSTLQDLSAEYLSTQPIDPYTGTPLIYHRDGRSFKVYSVGINRKDDGGVWDALSDLQSSRRGNPLDVGIAVGTAARVTAFASDAR
jgi:hypothetical protein